MAQVQTPIIPIVGDLVRATPGTISLGQGMVGYGPPRQAVEAARRASSEPGTHQYGAVEGTSSLRRALEEKLRSENRIPIGPGNRVVVTAGGNMAFLNAILAVADVGDEIVLQTPYYFNHDMAIGMAGCRTVCVPTDDQYQLRPDAIERAITPRTRAIVTVSPNNPTGAVYPEASVRAVNELCRARGIYHVHDEAYESFTYGGVRPFSAGAIEGSAAHTISLYSFSKAYGFAGWRIGYMVIPEDLAVAVRKIQDTNLICPPIISQAAALGALEAGSGYCREMTRGLSEVRETARRAFGEIAGFCAAPMTEGAFYLFLRLSSGLEPLKLVERLVREHRVAAIPGTAFGVAEGCTLRVAFGALEKETAAEGIGRLVRGLQAIVKG
ncbi:MAG TPA: pyridoxal phosphate-dependent aminotransferase [Planctomycetota bacterium]|jgi:aspartate/methionine/tyrosine aminotransferase|nr:pyridoxal phosphate-dependent aminotransferase [Planctomycetota bacterium]